MLSNREEIEIVCEVTDPAALRAVVADGTVVHAVARSAARRAWEARFLDAGFRKPPFSVYLRPYLSLESESKPFRFELERIPDAVLEAYPLDVLMEQRGLHMDMLREAGRRSDAHIARYVLANEFVAEGGRVLDAACGLGYGSAILLAGRAGSVVGLDLSEYAVEYGRLNYPGVRFEVQDINERLPFEDGSFDFVSSFETLEHVSDCGPFLAEVSRLLRVGGRFIGSVPNLWCDETGSDPNPYHFQVFDYGKLLSMVGEFLVPVKMYAQAAGGGAAGIAERELREVRLDLAAPPHTEWWIVVAEKR